MQNEVFERILHRVKLPLGELLGDKTTYRVSAYDFPILGAKAAKDLEMFDKFLVLSDGNLSVVGGVLFYGNTDIQITTLPKFRGMRYMSEIHRNGILASECHEGQQVSITTHAIRSFDDFKMKSHLLKLAGLKAKNIDEVYRYLSMLHYPGIEGYDENSFVEEFLYQD